MFIVGPAFYGLSRVAQAGRALSKGWRRRFKSDPQRHRSISGSCPTISLCWTVVSGLPWALVVTGLIPVAPTIRRIAQLVEHQIVYHLRYLVQHLVAA